MAAELGRSPPGVDLCACLICALLLPGVWTGVPELESRSSSPVRPSAPSTRLYLLRHTERIDFVDHSWVQCALWLPRMCRAHPPRSAHRDSLVLRKGTRLR